MGEWYAAWIRQVVIDSWKQHRDVDDAFDWPLYRLA
jgi:hypothetical protein